MNKYTVFFMNGSCPTLNRVYAADGRAIIKYYENKFQSVHYILEGHPKHEGEIGKEEFLKPINIT